MAERVSLIGDPKRPVRVVEDPAQVEDVLLAEFLARWRRARGDAPLPRHAWFDPRDLRSKLPFVVVNDALPDLEDFRYRVIGSRVCEYFGFNSTGKTVTEAFATTDLEIGRMVKWIMRQACRLQRPIRLCGPEFVINKLYCPAYDTVYFPCAADGENADRVVSIFVFNPAGLLGSRDPMRLVAKG